jgi:glycerol-3-phosphate dehydrogenase
MELEMEKIRSALTKFDGQSFDVAIIGGGINGCSAAQHLAASGYKVLLVEKRDFASGATSRSGRILHCGLRFLAPQKSVSEFLFAPGTLLMKLRTARDMAIAQGELYNTIRAYLRPMDIALPIYKHAGYRGWHVDIGAALVRLMNRGRSPINYRRWKGAASPHPFVKHLANQGDIQSVVAFTDQQFRWPERIALDACLNAEDMGAVIRNYTEVVRLEKSGKTGWKLTLADSEHKASIAARYVLNLAGIEIDRTNRMVPGLDNIPPRVRAMKGVHVLIRLPEEFRGHGIAGENSEGEHIFCLPWGEYHYLGPTETFYDGHPDEVAPLDEDIDFIIREAQALLPGLPIKDAKIEMAWAGARPITFDPGRAKGKRLPFSIFHDMVDHGARNLLAVTWGIIVNHRQTARRVTQKVKGVLGTAGPAKTINYSPRGTPALTPTSSQAEIERAVRYFLTAEHAASAVDILCRRTPLFWDKAVTLAFLSRIVDAMGSILQWSDRRKQAEVESFAEYVWRNHRVKLPS